MALVQSCSASCPESIEFMLHASTRGSRYSAGSYTCTATAGNKMYHPNCNRAYCIHLTNVYEQYRTSSSSTQLDELREWAARRFMTAGCH